MSAELKAGAAAPDFSIAGDDGSVISLKSLRGKKAVLYFYPKDDTSGCTRQAIDFSGLKAKFAAAGTDVIGISADSTDSHQKFRKKHKLSVQLGADPEKTMLEAYGVWAEKSMYGRKYMGIERTTLLIDAKGKIARIWPKVKVPGHAEEVLATAEAL